MVSQGIVLGHVISKKGIEVDKAKVKLIAKLPPPTSVKAVRQFLGHVGFYRRLIKVFQKFPSLSMSYWKRMLNMCGVNLFKRALKSSNLT